MYLIDTDIIIYSLKGDRNVIDEFERNAASPMAISVVTYGELVYGAEKSSHRSENLAKIKRISEIYPVIELTRGVMDIYGGLKADLERSGRGLDDFDLLIAATAMLHNYRVVTGNVRHFSRIEGLEVESWVSR